MQESQMYQMPTQRQVDEAMQRARFERARMMRDGLNWMGQQITNPIRNAFGRRV